MTFKETMAGLFATSEGTYYKWKKEKRPIINLLEAYFTKDELVEFLHTTQIRRQEIVKNYTLEELQNKLSDITMNDMYMIFGNFKRRSLIYLLFILKNENINSVKEFFTHLKQDQESKFFTFIQKIKYDSNNISFPTYSKEFEEYFEKYFHEEYKIKFILENKTSIIELIETILDKKMYKV